MSNVEQSRTTEADLNFSWMRDGLDHANVTATLQTQAESADPTVAEQARQKLEKATALFRQRALELEQGK